MRKAANPHTGQTGTRDSPVLLLEKLQLLVMTASLQHGIFIRSSFSQVGTITSAWRKEARLTEEDKNIAVEKKRARGQ